MPNQDGKGLTEKQRYWRTHLEACEKSEQNVTSFATTNGLDRRVLYSWRSRLQRMGLLGNLVASGSPRSRERSSSVAASRSGSQTSKLGFSTVRVVDLNQRGSALRIRFPNGIILETGDSSGPVPSHELLSVLAALR